MKHSIFYFLFACIFLFTSCDEDEVCTIDQSLSIETSSVNQLSSETWGTYTDIVINDSAEEVWSVLTNFDNMSSWSSSLLNMEGDIRNGGMVTLTFLFVDQTTGEGSPVDLDRTLVYEEGVLFGWSEPFELAPGSGIFIADNHRFRVEAISECQARFIQTDDFTGTIPVAAGVSLEQVAGIIETGYKIFNKELKAEVEK